VAPRGTPQAVVERLNAALQQLAALPDVKARFANDAVESATGPAAQLAQFIERDFASWRQVVVAQNLKIDAA
jgi:tripartite-type tricarboxylate transporter receptor subunit TctC